MINQKCKLSEEELIVGLQARSEEAFRCLYLHCFHLCKNFILTNGGTEEDAKDFFQDAIIVLLDEAKLTKFLAYKKAKVSTFLITIFRYKWFNHMRAGKKIKIVDIEDTLKDHASEDLIEILAEPINDYEKIYQECMQTIGDVCQKVILMALGGRKSEQEIATLFDWTIDYVRVRRFRCMQILRECAKKSLFPN
ncbi:RNA polymerase sigma factor [Haliscomenobacter sp.]|uniref:RNA polymerase sigma factor n=1 Tax=Haliscomenobacter sp. TaxID=2717303 RepID=UPI0035943AF5